MARYPRTPEFAEPEAAEAPPVTARVGDVVLYHYEGRGGLVTLAAMVLAARADGCADLFAYVAPGTDEALDLGAQFKPSVPSATEPTAGAWTTKPA